MKVEYSIHADLDEADLEETLIKISWESGGIFVKNLRIVGGWTDNYMEQFYSHDHTYPWMELEDIIGVIPSIHNETSPAILDYWKGRNDGSVALRLFKFKSGATVVVKNDVHGRLESMIFESLGQKSIIKYQSGFFNKIQYKDIIVEKRSNGDLIWKSGKFIGRYNPIRHRDLLLDFETGELQSGNKVLAKINVDELQDVSGTWRLPGSDRRVQNALENFGDHVILPIEIDEISFEELNFDEEFNLEGAFSAENSYIVVYGNDFSFQIDPDPNFLRVTRMNITKFESVPLNPRYMVELCDDPSISWYGKLKTDFLRYPKYSSGRKFVISNFNSEWKFPHGKVFLTTSRPSGEKSWRFESSGNMLTVTTSPIDLVLSEVWEYLNGDRIISETMYLNDNYVLNMNGSWIDGVATFDLIKNGVKQFRMIDTDKNEFGKRMVSYMTSDSRNLITDVGTENARRQVLEAFVKSFRFKNKASPRYFLRIWKMIQDLMMDKPFLHQNEAMGG